MRLVVIASLLATATVAHAQVVTYKPELDPDRFVLTSDPLSVGVLDSARPLSPVGNFTFAASMRVGGPPLQVCVQDGSGMCTDQGNIVRTRLTSDLVAAYGFGRYGVYGQLPIVLDQGSDYDPSTARLSVAGVGDLRLGGKALVWTKNAHALGADLRVSLPTGNSDFTSDGASTAEGRAIYDYRHGRYGAVAQLGYAWRQHAARLANLYVDDEVLWAAGGEYWVTPEKVTVGVSVFGRVGIMSDPNPPMGARAAPGWEERPIETMASARWWVTRNWIAEGGAGMGLTDGYGAPSFRVLAGARYIHEKPFPRPCGDEDGDGLDCKVDRCPNDPEDKDGFDDTDGCPDNDNDRDTILDKDDKCPNDPEDFDQFEDTDGCAEIDNDKDGILDKDDRCPNDPEDFDGFEDTDGCPELDNDKDGILDRDDKCPLDPEDKDGFEDEDGCPDLDNDHDGLLDKDDKCPDEAETFNGFEDTDGCPDKPSTVVITPTQLEIKETIYFDTDKATIKAKSYQLLDGVAAAIIAHNLEISIEGHTDDRADDTYNLGLSQRRADAVREYLISRGVKETKLHAAGFGETRPKVPCCKNLKPKEREAARDLNRRVEFLILNSPAQSAPSNVPTLAPSTSEPAKE